MPAETISKMGALPGGVSFVEGSAGGGEGFVKGSAHAYGLGALAGEEEGWFWWGGHRCLS